MTFDHYLIRPLTTADLHPYFAMVEQNRPRLEDFFTGTVSRTQTLADTQVFLEDITARAEARTYFPFVIADRERGTLAGFLDLKNIDWSVPKTEMGAWMDAGFAGKGLATKAFRIFCDHCFETPGFRKLFLRTHESNTAARRLAEGSGFMQEGILRRDYKAISGELVDLIYYGRIA